MKVEKVERNGKGKGKTPTSSSYITEYPICIYHTRSDMQILRDYMNHIPIIPPLSLKPPALALPSSVGSTSGGP
jgi:hypothetical protein